MPSAKQRAVYLTLGLCTCGESFCWRSIICWFIFFFFFFFIFISNFLAPRLLLELMSVGEIHCFWWTIFIFFFLFWWRLRLVLVLLFHLMRHILLQLLFYRKVVREQQMNFLLSQGRVFPKACVECDPIPINPNECHSFARNSFFLYFPIIEHSNYCSFQLLNTLVLNSILAHVRVCCILLKGDRWHVIKGTHRAALTDDQN